MSAALFIVNAHALDVITLRMALNKYDISGEYGVLATAGADLTGLLLMKAVGVALLVGIALSPWVRAHWRLRYLTLATVGGLVPALVNLAALGV